MNTLSRCKPLLGTYVEVSLTAEETRDTLIDMSIAAYAQIEKIQKLMSFHDTESELTHINKFAYQHPCKISPETEEVLLQALEISRLTDGLFDISIAPELIGEKLLPDINVEVDTTANWQDLKINNREVVFKKKMLLDLGGIAKGFAVDKAISIFNDDVEVVINAGGDLRMSHWQDKNVTIKYTTSKNDKAIDIPMRAPAIATSANYYLDGKSAIISPKTNLPTTENNCYSVFASTCMLADALTKIVFLSDKKNNLVNSFGAHPVSINEDGLINTL